MEMIKKLLVVLLSAIIFLGTAVTPVSAEGLSGKPTRPDPTTEPDPETVIEDETVEEEISEVEVDPEDEQAEEVEETPEFTETEEPEDNSGDLELPADYTAQIEDQLKNAFDEMAGLLADDDPVVNDTKDMPAAPSAEKKLESNHDGTYTLSLSVTGESQSGTTDEVHKANVVIILDRSNSMGYATTYRYNADTYNASYGYYRATWGTNGSPRNDRRVYYVANGNDGAGWYDNTNGTGTRRVLTNGDVYVTRLTGAQMAIGALTKELLSKNTEYDDLIEVQVISFASVRGDTIGSAQGHGSNDGSAESPWVKGTSNSTIMTYVNSNTLYGGTNWQAALEYGKEELDAKKALDEAGEDSDPESYYAIFVTDGEPTFYGHGTQWANNANGYQGGGSSWSQNCQDGANTAAKAIVDADYEFYSIFAFGSGTTQQNYLRRTTVYAYDGVDYSGTGQTAQSNREKYDNEYFFDAANITDLMAAFQHMIDKITNTVGFGNVSFTDGMSTDVTASTLVAGQATGFEYTVSGGVGNLYKVTAEGNDVRFYISGTEYTTSTDPAVVKKTDEASGKDYYSVTVNGTEYKMALANMNDDGIITWDLAAVGTLLGGYTYTVSFIVWPDQEAYDYVAGLNNGLDGYTWNDGIAEWDDKGYYKGGVAKYPSIVKYPNGVYAVLTNTEQSLSYSIMEIKYDEDGNVIGREPGPIQTIELETADPMGLDGSSVDIEKVWQSGLAINELQDLIFENGTYTGYKVVLDVYEDGGTDPYMTFTFPELNAAGKPVDADGNETTDVTKLVWAETLAIAPGIMVSEEAAARSGLVVTGYTHVTMEEEVEVEDEDGNVTTETREVTYYILPHAAGHDYEIEEVEGSDLHFEFETIVYHPMLVDDVLKNVKFVMNGDEIVDGSVAEVIGDGELQTFEAFNILKGGLNIYKNIGIDNKVATIVKDDDGNATDINIDETKLVKNVKDEFTFIVKLTDDEGNPVYTTDDQFNPDGSTISGSIGYRIYDADGATLDRGPIPEGGVLTLTMPADGTIRIVNMPSGTNFEVTEVEEDTEEKVYNFLLIYSDLAKGDNDGTITSREFLDATEENKYTGKAVGNAAVEVNFFNWTDAYFYVYHSSDNEVERIPFTDERVVGTYDAEAGKYVYTFDIVNEVKAESQKHDYLYGGYYSDYAGKSEGYDSLEVETWTENKYTDAEGKPYDYANIEVNASWNYDDAYDVSGFRMNPEPKETYYLKEVPTGYIQPYTQYTYYKTGYKLANLYAITAVDDLNYEFAGFVVQTEREAKIYRTLTIKAEHSTSITTLSPEKTFKAQGVQKGYMGYADITDIIGTEVTGITQFWDTKDNVRVFGIKQRKLNNGTTITSFKKTDTDYDNKPIDLNPPAAEGTEEGGE